jgi:hypothetical protein
MGEEVYRLDFAFSAGGEALGGSVTPEEVSHSALGRLISVECPAERANPDPVATPR